MIAHYAFLECFSPNEKHSPYILTRNFNHLTGIWRFQSDDYCSNAATDLPDKTMLIIAFCFIVSATTRWDLGIELAPTHWMLFFGRFRQAIEMAE
jgi:hypothetical protein